MYGRLCVYVRNNAHYVCVVSHIYTKTPIHPYIVYSLIIKHILAESVKIGNLETRNADYCTSIIASVQQGSCRSSHFTSAVMTYVPGLTDALARILRSNCCSACGRIVAEAVAGVASNPAGRFRAIVNMRGTSA